MLQRLQVKVPSNQFFHTQHDALSEQLDPLARPFKTLGTKYVKSTSILRVDTHRRRYGNRRKRSTAYYVEYGDNTLMSHKSPEEMQQHINNGIRGGYLMGTEDVKYIILGRLYLVAMFIGIIIFVSHGNKNNRK